MSILKKCFLIVICAPFVVFANEAKEEKKPGEAAGAGKEIPAWMEIQNRLSMLQARISAAESALKRLIEEKNHVPAGSSRLKEITREMVTQHKDLERFVADYNKQSAILKFRYPERIGKTEEAHKDHGPVKSLEDMELELGLDGRLERNMKKMRSQYDDPNKKKEEVTSKPEQKKDEKTIEDSDAVILKK